MKTTVFIFFLSTIFAVAQAVPRPSNSTIKSRVIYQSPTSLILENIAVRSSSQLLITSAAAPTLFTLDPTTPNDHNNATLTPVHTFPNATSLTGITEYRPGVFALVASTINTTTRRTAPGSITIWSIDLNPRVPSVHLIASLPSAPSANGLTAMPHHPDILLTADSVAGTVRQVNTRTGEVRLAVQDASMQPGLPAPALGVNGIHARADSYLYFANSARGSFARVKFASDQGGNINAAGEVETLVTMGVGQSPDDFAFDARGRAWVAVHPGALALVSPATGNWTQETVVGNVNGTDPGVNQPTSAAFGRGDSVQEGIIYVTTAVGQVVAVDARG
ncbi:hypothetical protein C8R46DRAFT_922206 [Mycena filopes]|nr:hypothetical protein C8R46DRAFT_922206 [Mycena filopes]